MAEDLQILWFQQFWPTLVSRGQIAAARHPCLRQAESSLESTMSPIPEVALLLETSREYSRQLLRGIVRYAPSHGPWSFVVSPGHFE